MNSRERIRKVLSHELPDRVPNGLGGCETAGLHMIAYDKLQKILHKPHRPTRLDTFMVNAVFEDDIIKAMEGDILLLASPNMCGAMFRGRDNEKQWKEQILWGGVTYKVAARENFVVYDDGRLGWNGNICPVGGYYFDSPHPLDLTAAFDTPDPDKFFPRNSFSDEFLRNIERVAKHYYETTEFALSMGECITDLQVQPGGYVGHMVLMKSEPELMAQFLDKCIEASFKMIEQLDEAIGKYTDILCVAHDFGDNRGVTIGGDTWRKVYKPAYKKWFEGWHKRTGMKINFHSCGMISDILSDLADCGMDIYNPVQTDGKSMSPGTLKEKFGDRIIFYGGAYNAQQVSVSDSYEKIYSHVAENIEHLKQGGNYIMAGVHNLPGDMPEHHISAMIDAYCDTRNY